MSPQDPPTFLDYQRALERLRRRAHLRRAVMVRGVTASLEMPAYDDQEDRDRQICQWWETSHGPALPGY